MTTQNVTLNIPDAIYSSLKSRAEQAQRSVEEETLELLALVVPVNAELPQDLSRAIESLKLLDEGELMKAARSRLPAEVNSETEELNRKQQREGLSDSERRRLTDLVKQYERNMLVRAQAAALLRERGHDPDEVINP